MASRESHFSKELREDLELLYGERIHINLIPDMMRTGKKVYDFYFVLADHFSGIECKFQRGHTFNIKNAIKPHQPGCLRSVYKSGGTGLFVICFNDYKTSFILTPDQLDSIQKIHGDSVKFDIFVEGSVAQEMKRIKDEFRNCTRWQVEKLVDVTQRY